MQKLTNFTYYCLPARLLQK